MKSFASIDRINHNIAICEVENLAVEYSRTEDFAKKETIMMDISLDEIVSVVGTICEGDIIVTEHNGEAITKVYCKDDQEKQRRINCLNAIMMR